MVNRQTSIANCPFSLGLYIQFPFCASKCSFCNFTSRVAPGAAYVPYARAVVQEICLLAEIRPDLFSLCADSVYCGGGTPSLAGRELLQSIFLALRSCVFPPEPIEWTLEITPGSADRVLLDGMRRLGVNRLSIGAQSFDDRELASVGRLHTAAGTRMQAEVARAIGFENISLDLIAGLPYQTEASWQKTLEEAIGISPEHVSVYLFEADEASRLGRESASLGNRFHAGMLPGEEFMAEAYEQARETMERHGYIQYEISNFARPGYESKHNRKYWELQPYVGLGAGAHSFDGSRRWSNVIEPEIYQARVGRGEVPIAEIRELSSVEQVEEFFFLGLRQRQGIRLETARQRWGSPPLNWWEGRADELKQEGLLREQQGRLFLAKNAYLISNEVFQRFLLN